jgi:hypothetical protein
MFDAENEVTAYLNNPDNARSKEIVHKTKAFLSGFYSAFALELLSSIDFIMKENNVSSVEDITKHLENWSDRKKTLFTNPNYITLAVNNIHKHLD